MAAKNYDEFCEQHHLLTTGNCHMIAECEECREIWNAATEAVEVREKQRITAKAQNSPKHAIALLERVYNRIVKWRAAQQHP